MQMPGVNKDSPPGLSLDLPGHSSISLHKSNQGRWRVENAPTDNFAFGYFPKMLKTWGLLMVVKNALPKSTHIYYYYCYYYFGEMMPLVHLHALLQNRGRAWRETREVTFHVQLDAL